MQNDYLKIGYFRGELLESFHTLAVSVLKDNQEIGSFGDTKTQKYFTRSVAKIIQAYVCLEILTQQKFLLSPEEIAVISSSHSGTIQQVNIVKNLLDRAGLSEQDLRCGVHPPVFKKRAEEKFLAGLPFDRLDHNCSGKHTAMLIASKLSGWDLESYFQKEHPLQIKILGTLAMLAEIENNEIIIGTDGCGVPNFALSLQSMGKALASLLNRYHAGDLLSVNFFNALCQQRKLLAGPGRFINEISEHLAGQYFIKDGAEGYLLIVNVEQKLIIVLKVLDGAIRPFETATAYLINKYFSSLQAKEIDYLKCLSNKELKNTRAEVIGHITVL